jgi:CPA1 family monovalent cation:H+ antiporter
MRRIDDPLIEITLTVLAAYGSFSAAEAIGVSGVIATVVAGMVCGNYAAERAMSQATRVAVNAFWEYVAFALNSLVFLLLGLEVGTTGLLSAWKPILIAFAAVAAARIALIALVRLSLLPTRERFPRRWSPILALGGIRGALSMVLAISVPDTLPGRELLITLTFGVVLITIVLQGLAVGPVLRASGLCDEEPAVDAMTNDQ